MFAITNKNDQNAWLEYKREIKEWKSYKTKQEFWVAKDMTGYEKRGREIEDKWRVVFNDLEKQQQKQKITEQDAANAFIALSKVKVKKEKVKKCEKESIPTRRSARFNKAGE